MVLSSQNGLFTATDVSGRAAGSPADMTHNYGAVSLSFHFIIGDWVLLVFNRSRLLFTPGFNMNGS